MGTVLTVTNPKTGQSVTVTINDRGPFGISCRVGAPLDLAMGAAQRIGMHNAQYVCVSILKDKEQEIEAKMDATTATVGLSRRLTRQQQLRSLMQPVGSAISFQTLGTLFLTICKAVLL